MEAEHPSFALVAYTAAIEAISYTSWAQVTCGVPAGSGSNKRVRKSLEFACTEEQFEFLSKKMDVYGERSGTAHGGQLGGLEVIYGAVFDLGPPPGFPLATDGEAAAEDPVRTFTLGVVPLMRFASRQLIVGAASEPTLR